MLLYTLIVTNNNLKARVQKEIPEHLRDLLDDMMVEFRNERIKNDNNYEISDFVVDSTTEGGDNGN